MIQEAYWIQMYQLKARTYFVEHYLTRLENFDRFYASVLLIFSCIGVILSYVSSNFNWLLGVWPLIVTLITILAKGLCSPYKIKLKTYKILLHEFEKLMNSTEREWNSIFEGYFTLKQIVDARIKIKENIHELLFTHDILILPKIKSVEKKAAGSALNYFYITYLMNEQNKEL